MSQIFPFCVQLASAETMATQGAAGVSGGSSARGSHQLADIDQCPRRWYLRYERQLVPCEDTPWRMLGTLVHLALAYRYAERMASPPEWYCREPLEAAFDRVGRGAPGLILEARDVVAAYERTWSKETISPLHVEQEFSATVGQLDPGGPDSTLDAEVVTCRPDLIAGKDGRVMLYDHKCTGGTWNNMSLPRWTTDNEYRIPWQAMFYLHIIRANGIDASAFVINRVKRKKPYDFDRQVLVIPSAPYERTPRTIRDKVAREAVVRRALRDGVPPSAHFWSCFHRFGACDYVDLCTTDEGARGALLRERVLADGTVVPARYVSAKKGGT